MDIDPHSSRRKRHYSSEMGGVSKDKRIHNESTLSLLEGASHLVEANFEVVNEGSMRQEIEVALMTLNGNKFIGTITPQEAKFSIYRDSLGFGDFANFDGVRFAYRGVPVVVFRLKNFIKTDTFQLFTEHKTAGRLFSIPLMYDPLLWKRFLILKKNVQTSKQAVIATARKCGCNVFTKLFLDTL